MGFIALLTFALVLVQPAIISTRRTPQSPREDLSLKYPVQNLPLCADYKDSFLKQRGAIFVPARVGEKNGLYGFVRGNNFALSTSFASSRSRQEKSLAAVERKNVRGVDGYQINSCIMSKQVRIDPLKTPGVVPGNPPITTYPTAGLGTWEVSSWSPCPRTHCLRYHPRKESYYCCPLYFHAVCGNFLCGMRRWMCNGVGSICKF